MSTADIAAEKIKSLSEPELRSVLDFIERLRKKKAPPACELLKLTASERDRILEDQAIRAENLYRRDSAIIAEDWDEPLDYA